MSTASRDDELRELMALHAVGALSEAEQQELELAMADRPDLRKEMDALRDLASTMADAVSEPPPAALRAGVLEAIATTPQLPPVSRPVESAEPAVAPVIPIDRARRRRWLSLGAVAAAVVALVVGVAIVAPWSDDAGNEVAAVLDDPSAVSIPLEGELAGLRLVHSAEHGATVLVGENVPAPEGEQVYELWQVEEERPARVDIFRPDDGGDVELLVEGMDPTGEVFAVTIEPAGGSEQPTSDVIAITA